MNLLTSSLVLSMAMLASAAPAAMAITGRESHEGMTKRVVLAGRENTDIPGKRGLPTTDIIITRLIGSDVNDALPNAYQVEIDNASVDPASVLGKREDVVPLDAAAIIAVIRIIAADAVPNAYQNEIDEASTAPENVLGKRGLPTTDIIITRLVGSDVNDALPNAYQVEIDNASADPASVLGKREDVVPLDAAAIIGVIRIIAADAVPNAYQDEIDSASASPESVLGSITK